MTSGAMASVRAALAAGLLWSTPALAEDIGAPVPARVRENAGAVARMMDADRDGRISKAEFLRHSPDEPLRRPRRGWRRRPRSS
jgi:hypothetical protein